MSHCRGLLSPRYAWGFQNFAHFVCGIISRTNVPFVTSIADTVRLVWENLDHQPRKLAPIIGIETVLKLLQKFGVCQDCIGKGWKLFLKTSGILIEEFICLAKKLYRIFGPSTKQALKENKSVSTLLVTVLIPVYIVKVSQQRGASIRTLRLAPSRNSWWWKPCKVQYHYAPGRLQIAF